MEVQARVDAEGTGRVIMMAAVVTREAGARARLDAQNEVMPREEMLPPPVRQRIQLSRLACPMPLWMSQAYGHSFTMPIRTVWPAPEPHREAP